MHNLFDQLLLPSVVELSILDIVALVADHPCHGMEVVGSVVSPEHVLMLHVLGLLNLFLAQRDTFLEGQSEILPEVLRHRWVQAAAKNELRDIRLFTLCRLRAT